MKAAIIVETEVKSEHREAYLDVMRKHAQRTLDAEPDCLQFDIVVPDDDSSRIFLVEVYRDLKAREAHLQGPLLPLVKDAQKDMIIKRRIVMASI